ncbi:hypothetical protein N0V88_001455 [Collariella sp. IMI 366227]|nr:hypothetical protein N0V88_001455 [Collariella sp. IMI 366227]
MASGSNAVVDLLKRQDGAPGERTAILMEIRKIAVAQDSSDNLAAIVERLADAARDHSEPKMASPHTPTRLLTLATGERYDADLDTFMAICTPALAYLTFQVLQPAFLNDGGFCLLQRAFHQLYTRFDITELDPDFASQLKQVGDTFLTIFADISALPEFSTACPLDSRAVATLMDWLKLPPNLSHLQTAACLSLGNLSRSDESSTKLVDASGPLIDILLVHAALSFLKNLAIPPANKAQLGSLVLDPSGPMILAQIWNTTRTQPQLQFAAVSLARLLLVNSPSNVNFICAPLPNNAEHSTNLSLLHSIAFAADEEPIKMEAARAVALVCRALHTSPVSSILDKSWTSSTTPSPTNPSEPTLHSFYTTHSPQITTSLSLLLTQSRFPTVRSEAIFTLALMSRSSPAGARMALDVLQYPSTTANTTLTPAQAAATAAAAAAAAGWPVLAEAIAGSKSLVLPAANNGTATDSIFTTEKTNNQPTPKENEDSNEVTMSTLSLTDLTPQAPTQQKQPAQIAAKMDRENGMLLVASLLHRFPDELAPLQGPLQAVLEKGGELVSEDRARE